MKHPRTVCLLLSLPVLVALAWGMVLTLQDVSLWRQGFPAGVGPDWPARGPLTLLVASVVSLVGSLLCIFFQSRKIARLARELDRRQGRDLITGLPGRPRFMEELAAEIGRSSRYLDQFCLAMVDIDGLKMINEFYGREAGDLAIRTVRDTVRDIVRTVDGVYALGSGQFGVIMPSTDLAGGYVLAERLRSTLESVVVPWKNGRELSLTVSSGLVESQGRCAERPDAIINRAEGCLSRAKHGGRNRVCRPDDIPSTEC